MRISVFGLGYVGCVSAACFAAAGHTVIGLDTNHDKLELLVAGIPPIIEPGLNEVVEKVIASGALRAACDSQMAVRETELSLICVGTPSNENGSIRLDYIQNVCREIGAALAEKQDYHVVVVRSTVLPGTVEEKLIPLLELHSGRKAGVDFGVCMNPEFLREGSALQDFGHPGLIVIGELDAKSGDMVQELYDTPDAETVRTSLRVAEMVKYTSNAFHALKIAFANEIGNLCQANGIDGRELMGIFTQDTKLNISNAYLKPGFAFGGSCLPKDVRALLYRARELDLEPALLGAILPSNQKQIERGIRLVERTGCKKIGVFGLSFKAETDDLRESPAVILVETLLGRGYQVRIFDDNVQLSRLVGANKSFLERELPHIASLMCASVEDLVAQSEVVVVTTGSKAFQGALHLMEPPQTLIDLVGFAKTRNSLQSAYEGICW